MGISKSKIQNKLQAISNRLNFSRYLGLSHKKMKKIKKLKMRKVKFKRQRITNQENKKLVIIKVLKKIQNKKIKFQIKQKLKDNKYANSQLYNKKKNLMVKNTKLYTKMYSNENLIIKKLLRRIKKKHKKVKFDVNNVKVFFKAITENIKKLKNKQKYIYMYEKKFKKTKNAKLLNLFLKAKKNMKKNENVNKNRYSKKKKFEDRKKEKKIKIKSNFDWLEYKLRIMMTTILKKLKMINKKQMHVPTKGYMNHFINDIKKMKAKYIKFKAFQAIHLTRRNKKNNKLEKNMIIKLNFKKVITQHIYDRLVPKMNTLKKKVTKKSSKTIKYALRKTLIHKYRAFSFSKFSVNFISFVSLKTLDFI